jgi:hypothetical protein
VVHSHPFRMCYNKAPKFDTPAENRRDRFHLALKGMSMSAEIIDILIIGGGVIGKSIKTQ